ncbi:peroxiredoxin [Azohydromonas lata]|uniref:thioredoxin-dependent peroxiredoxin n=1 Tax=Azohydromonas lata TaxID=45677 RepID=A0ABU5ID95_9BURK|nr:peroxiredoxin [Azohydromonas lata]MDZ5457090.1 peroxiredoxin [Azohydromonas lata]
MSFTNRSRTALGALSRVLAAATTAVAATVFSTAAHAALPVGAAAPDFNADAALGGNTFHFKLAEALRKGPVVLYFYPRAFTSGCTQEAHAFAEATPVFEALGATVIGMSNDDIATLQKFSVEACRNRFAVAADAGARVMKAYDAALWVKRDMADRISYAISPQGKVMAVYSSLNPDGHVDAMLKAVQDWKRAQPVQPAQVPKP